MTHRHHDTMSRRTTGDPFDFGQHLIMNLTGCPLEIIGSAERLSAYVTGLVDVIDMVAYGPPQLNDFGHASPDTSGFTATQAMVTQLIETSLISGHLVNARRTAYWDVFSCREFDITKALDYTEAFFTPRTMGWQVLWR